MRLDVWAKRPTIQYEVDPNLSLTRQASKAAWENTGQHWGEPSEAAGNGDETRWLASERASEGQ